MKTILSSFILIFFVSTSEAQNKRFYYDYTFSNDSTNLDMKKEERLILEVSPLKSVFYSSKVNEIDSVNQSRKMDSRYIITPYRDVLFREVIVTEGNKTKLYYMGGWTSNYYEVNLDNDVKWTILPETQAYENYTIQKATAKINNRIWNVWFAKDIPLNIGPYIFKGLPGLIVIAEDKMKSHSFRLAGISNIEKAKDTLPIFQSDTYRGFSKVVLKPKEFKKLLENLESEFLNIIIRPTPAGIEVTTSTYYDSSGNRISEAEYIKIQKEGRKKILRNNNNKLINDFKR